ncbi:MULTISPECIES: alpha/beta hydrolase [unclassified Aureimonas]|uniref:alpha/beta hydrolase n=1 Tax=unclassified Aureimonas TaxID=2615206 RepID=UPI0006F5982D|nr:MULTISPECIES: alpha/beta fold hydrolase [unclassified Aureimonas]KQT60560.1 lysophospholipase [Aureimonas sp. Leaf427]KQT79437.1 lysophospholipase [Aureimonas sp. Leaf460]
MRALILRLVLALVVVLALAAGGVWLFGPREPADLTLRFDPAAIGADPDAYLARTEADVPNLRPDAAKSIVWAYPASRAKTPLAVVYIHGFSGSREDLRPLPDEVAERLGANLYFTRLAGHGRDGAAMREASVNDWVNDLAEALAIGREIGERVVVISTSTGATLATLGATLPDLAKSMDGLVLVSPNFGLPQRYAFVLDLPFARDLLPWLTDETYSFTPVNDAQAANWTVSYPTAALLPMAALVRTTVAARLDAITLPAFFLYSPADTVVDPTATEAVAARWGGPKQVLQVPSSGDPANHVIAGRILSPQTTEELAARIADWIAALPAK